MKIHKFSKNEEIVNAITHGIGVFMSFSQPASLLQIVMS